MNAAVILDRIVAKVDFEGPDGCWQWTASLTSHGYGQLMIERKRARKEAYRVLYQIINGPVPAGLVLDHLCRNSRCVNPDHLDPVTQAINVKRGQWGKYQRPARTTCPNGHALTDDNAIWETTPRGTPYRRCRTCRREQARQRRTAA